MSPEAEVIDARTTDALPRLPAEPIQLRSPLEIIQHALNAKLAPAELREYFELYRTMKADEAAQAYAEAMNLCQSEMPAILRDRENSHTRSRYAAYESLNGIIKPIYTKHGFSLSFGEEPGEKDSPTIRIYCVVRHKGGHLERVQGDFPRDGKGMKGNDNMTPLQGTGSTYSYARRYLAKNIFNLAETNEDNDGNAPEQRDPEKIAERVQIMNEMLEARKPLGGLQGFLRWIFDVPKGQPIDDTRHRLDLLNEVQFLKACAQYQWKPTKKNGKEAGS